MRKKKQTLFIDRVIYFAAIIEPLFVLPQAIQIFRTSDASGVSILTWVGFNVLSAVWVWWAVVHKERVVMIYQGLFIIFNTLVIIGALLYGGTWI